MVYRKAYIGTRIMGLREMINAINVVLCAVSLNRAFRSHKFHRRRTNRAKDYPTTSVRCCSHRPLFRFTHVKTQCAVHLSVCLSIIIIIIGSPHIIHDVYTHTLTHTHSTHVVFLSPSTFLPPSSQPSCSFKSPNDPSSSCIYIYIL